MGVVSAFRAFLLSGSLISMAVAFVVGLAIVALIGALVSDIIDPLIGAALHVNFDNLGQLSINGSTLMGGAFLGAAITFFILMLVVFFLIAYPYQLYQARQAKKVAATTWACPACDNQISLKATRCGFCTSAVTPPTPASSTGAAKPS
ncbi:MAG TPA: MscL family protein [Thermoplasmata archaeon]|nr:MscL family protein [Thermoplasmata archaeon]